MFSLTWVACIFCCLWSAGGSESEMILERTLSEHQVRLDITNQKIRVSVPERFRYRGEQELPLNASMAGFYHGGLVSAATLAQKAKLFDDGLYAAVELACQNGSDNLVGKRQILKELADILAKSQGGESIDILLAGAKLGDQRFAIPEKFAANAGRQLSEFLGNELRSKPLGFYTWNESLSSIFRQDRMLQTVPKNPVGSAKIAKALASNPKLVAAYRQHLSLANKLTNRLKYEGYLPLLAKLANGEPVADQQVSFLPPSRAWETDLVEQLYGDKPIPEGFQLIEEMIRRIESGELKIHPNDQSGWYEYQTWALESLVIPDKMPEAQRLVFEDKYKKLLHELFKGVLALTRETHIKQLDIPLAGSAMPPKTKPTIWISPDLAVEPLPTYYQRRAIAYGFVRKVLEDHLGKSSLQSMHRQTAVRAAEPSLDEELTKIEQIFWGAYVASAHEIGLKTTENAEKLKAATTAFGVWSKQIAGDSDLAKDVRMMVPVFHDLQRRKTKVWAFLGWKSEDVLFAFQSKPTVASIKDKNGNTVANEDVIVKYGHQYANCAYPVFAELYVSQLLNRDEFRAHCDKYKTKDEILKNLK